LTKRISVETTGGKLFIPKDNTICEAEATFKTSGYDGDLLIVLTKYIFGISPRLSGVNYK
jgi:hypothetical protein